MKGAEDMAALVFAVAFVAELRDRTHALLPHEAQAAAASFAYNAALRIQTLFAQCAKDRPSDA